MKYIVILALLAGSLRTWAQTTPSADSLLESGIRKAVINTLADIEFWKPYPTTADHRNLYGKIMQEIRNGNDSLILRIVSTPQFSAFMVMENRNFVELTAQETILMELKSLRNAFLNSPIQPDTVTTDTLLGDISHIENWNLGGKDKTKPEFSVLFLNNQLTNFLIRKPEN